MGLKKYLPIGTVVMLKGGKKRIMITGFCCVNEEKNNKIYDYCGCYIQKDMYIKIKCFYLIMTK